MKIEAGQRIAWWKQRSFMERVLCITTILSLVLCIIAIFTLVLITSKLEFYKGKILIAANNNQSNTCLIPGCIQAAAEILNSINESVDPCDNFYDFVCGNFLKKTVIEEDQSSVSQGSLLTKELRRRLLELIDNLGNNPPFYLKNIKIYYASCMNKTDIENLGNDPLHNIIKELGDWPVVKGTRWEPYFFDWMETLKSIRQMGFNYNIFTSVYVALDTKNNTQYVIKLGQAPFKVDYTFFQTGLNKSKVLSAYYNLMVESAVMLGADREEAKAEMLEVIEFETELSKIIIPREEMRNMSEQYNRIKIKDLRSLAPGIEWDKYFKIIVNESLSPEEEIVVVSIKYIQNLSNLMKFKDEKKQKRILANFMIWKVVMDSLPYLNKEWRDLYQIFNTALTGKKREADRWEYCLRLISRKFLKAIGSIYSKEYLNEMERDQVKVIAKYVHQAFLENLNNIDWMDDITRLKAKQKAENMLLNIGYPDELLREDILSEFYVDLHLDESLGFFENEQIYDKWSTNRGFTKLKKINKRGDWENWIGVAIVNAFYYSSINALEIPAGILQGLFFNSGKPSYLNFGSIGSVIGHEITHGFDDQGRQFDYSGNNFNWWEEQTEINFIKRAGAECIIHQYGNYTDLDAGMSVNGINTLGENIADNAMSKLAFWAYRQWVKDNKEEPSLPSLKYSPDQLFWISSVMTDCGKQRLEELKYRMTVDSHSPHYYRVIGTLSNVKEFSETFHCPLGSPMNPINKCVVW